MRTLFLLIATLSLSACTTVVVVNSENVSVPSSFETSVADSNLGGTVGDAPSE